MKILVIGAQGQVGCEIMQNATSLEDEWIGCGHQTLDITNKNSIKDGLLKYQPQIVVNAAAYTAVDQAEIDKEKAFLVNRDGVRSLAELCATTRIPLIHLSTDYVFDGSATRSYMESDKVFPVNTYGQSKAEGEEAIKTQLSEHIILRVSWVFGAQGNNFVKTILRLAREEDELKVVADQQGSPTAAADIAKVITQLVKAWQSKTLEWGTYHYTNAPQTNWYEFAKQIIEIGKRYELLQTTVVQPITTTEYPTLAKRPANSVLNCNKIMTALGIKLPCWKQSLHNVIKELYR